MNKFSPFVQITLAGERIAVMFDSLCSEDVTRCTNLVFVPLSADALSWEITDDSVDGRVGIKLLVTLDDSVKEHDLATVSMPDGTVNSVRQAFSSAFQSALAAYLQSMGAVLQSADRTDPDAAGIARERYSAKLAQAESAALAPVVPSVAASPDSGSSRAAARSSLRRSVAILATIGLVGFAVAYGVSGHSGRSVDPIKAAVAENMAQDPASILAQVELTKQTLRSMGVDPGRASDLGCLAAQ